MGAIVVGLVRKRNCVRRFKSFNEATHDTHLQAFTAQVALTRFVACTKSPYATA